MTNEDIKTSKKFMCAGELARVFKSMICLFLTTSYILLRFRIVSEQELDGDSESNIDGLTELATHLSENESSCKVSAEDTDFIDSAELVDIDKSQG